MKLIFTDAEIKLLQDKDISVSASGEYTEDEALDLLDQVREIEVSYSQFTSGKEKTLFLQYGELGDKIYAQIPEE